MRVCAVLLFCTSLALGTPLGQVDAEPYTIRFTDAPATATALQTPAKAWLDQHGWQQVWPPTLFGTQQALWFAGPAAERYLRVYADRAFYILTREVNLDPQALPWLSLTWGIERFPAGAALDLYGRNDRAIVVMVSFGERLGSGGLLPSVPRSLAFFWGETERVGAMYTCIPARDGPPDTRLQCKYPHVKYLALRQGDAGSVHTDRVNLLEHFQTQFPDYWQEHHKAPPIVGLSIEAASGKTQSISSARLYSLRFSTTADASESPPTR